MLSFTTSQRYFLYPGSVDMRKGFDSLSGLVIYYKRLEEGTFEIPMAEEGSCSVSMRWEGLVMLLEGIALGSQA